MSGKNAVVDSPAAPRARASAFAPRRSRETLIRRAAARTRKSVTEFILDSTCVAAEQALLEQCYFPVGSREWNAFQAALDRPPRAKPDLKRLLKTKAPWG